MKRLSRAESVEEVGQVKPCVVGHRKKVNLSERMPYLKACPVV